MSGNWKRIVLSLGEKVKILERLKNGEAGTKLAVENGVEKSTISDIKKNWDSIINFRTAPWKWGRKLTTKIYEKILR